MYLGGAEIHKNNIYLIMNLTTYEHNTRRKCDLHVLNCNTPLFKRGCDKYGNWVVQQDANWNKVTGKF
jgi:hypothetical protein